MKQRMNRLWMHLYDAKYFLIVISLMDVFFIYLAWLAYPEAFAVLIGLMVGVSLVMAGIPIALSMRQEKIITSALQHFLIEPDIEHEDTLRHLLPKKQTELIGKIGQQLREKEDLLTQQTIQVNDYERYIEEWVHEIKKPLSLLTLVLDNRQDEMSPIVQRRVTHSRNTIQSHIEKILYFSRLRTTHRDYLFESLDLKEVCQEAVDEHQSILEEANMTVHWKGDSQVVLSDRKSLLFILSQILHNSTTYATGENARLYFHFDASESVVLELQDNGPGIQSGDLPFIFDKGFTGGKERATGMGLFIAKRLADDLNVGLEARSPESEGLSLSLTFPQIIGNIH